MRRALAHELARARTPARPSPSRRARRRRGRRASRSPRGRRTRRPTRRPRSRGGGPVAAGRERGRRRAGREREAALVADPALVHLRVVARADALHLALADRRRWCCSRPGRGRRRWGRSGSPTGAPRSGMRWQVSAPTGHSSMTLPENGARYGSSSNVAITEIAPRFFAISCPSSPPPRRSACSGSRGCSARGRARSSARSGSASRTCASSNASA